MPKSKHRRSGKNRPRSRPAPRRVNETKNQGVIEASSRRLSPEMLHKIGWTAIALAVVVFFQHLLSHMGFFTVFGPGADDLLIGYPTAGILILVGVWALGKADG